MQKVDLSPIKVIAHDGSCLQILLETDNGYSIESLPAPQQAFQGLQQLARLASLTQSTRNSSIARNQMLGEIRMIPVNSSNVAAIGWLYQNCLRTHILYYTTPVIIKYEDQGVLQCGLKTHIASECGISV